MFRKKKKIQTTSSRSKAMAKADKWFSLYIRLRDSLPFHGKAIRCISCGRVVPFDECDNGHYINRQHMSLRFSELNCNAQCRRCNRFDEGNIQGYRKGLIEKIGLQKVELLEAMKYQANRLSAFELEQIAKHYKEESEKLKKELR